MTWVMKSAFCIACSKPLGIIMTENSEQQYFYCSECHKKEHIAKGIDIEKTYNENLNWLKKEGLISKQHNSTGVGN